MKSVAGVLTKIVSFHSFSFSFTCIALTYWSIGTYFVTLILRPSHLITSLLSAPWTPTANWHSHSFPFFHLHCSDLLVHRYVLCYTYTTPITPYHFPFVSALDTHRQLALSLFPISFTCIALTYLFIGTYFVTLNTSPTPNAFLSPAPS